MAWQKYPVPCACGKVHEVSAGAAGSSFACECGRTVEVPSLVKLKASAGESTVSADFELDQMIGTGALPMEDTCGVCGARTKHALRVTVVCEREDEKGGTPANRPAMGCLAFGPVGLFVLAINLFGWRPKRTFGQNLTYHLPIRVCESCDGEEWTEDATRSVLERTPLYARLLDKYPKAEVRLPVPLHE